MPRAKKPQAKKPRQKYVLDVAPDVQARIEEIAQALPEFSHVDASRVVCFRSRGSVARIYARIWGLDKIWQMALGVGAHYAVEVVEHFDRASVAEQDRTLIHELMHIPQTFSGALVPHNCFGKKIDCSSVEVLYERLLALRRARERARLAAPPALATGGGGHALARGATAAREVVRPERALDRFGDTAFP